MTDLAEPTSEETSTNHQAEIFHEAIVTQASIPSWLQTSLAKAVAGEVLPAVRDLHRFFDVENSQNADWDVERGGFTHLSPRGEIIDFAEALPWCTAKHHYGWGLPGEETIASLIDVTEAAGGLIEIGCGSGYWSAILRARLPNAHIVAADTGEDRTEKWTDRPWTDISRIDGVEAALQHHDLPILMVWAAPSDLAHRIATTIAPGRQLLVAGPPSVTANEAFWAFIDTDFDQIGAIPCVTSSGGPDDVRIFVKRAAPNPKPTTTYTKESERFMPKFFRSGKIAELV